MARYRVVGPKGFVAEVTDGKAGEYAGREGFTVTKVTERDCSRNGLEVLSNTLRSHASGGGPALYPSPA